MIETALVLPLLLLMLAGSVDLGRSLSSYIVVTNAAREGARYASRFPQHESGTIQAVVQEGTVRGVDLSAAQITIQCWSRSGGAISCEDAVSGDRTRVTLQYPHSVILGSLLGRSTIELTNATTMVVFGLDVVE